MRFIALFCVALMLISEIVSQLFGSSYSQYLYDFIGLDIQLIHAECVKLSESADINRCYIENIRDRDYLTRWPYVFSYIILFVMSFYNREALWLSIAVSFGFCMYHFLFFGMSSVAAWVNVIVFVSCLIHARKIIYGRV